MCLNIQSFQTAYFQYWQQCSPVKEINALSLLQCVWISWLYNLSLSVLYGQLELVMDIDLFMKVIQCPTDC